MLYLLIPSSPQLTIIRHSVTRFLTSTTPC